MKIIVFSLHGISILLCFMLQIIIVLLGGKKNYHRVVYYHILVKIIKLLKLLGREILLKLLLQKDTVTCKNLP